MSIKLINKSTAYLKLAEIKESHNVDVSKQVTEALNSEVVPMGVINLINEYDELPQLIVFDKIYEKRSKNPLYKTLTRENIDDSDKAIALSSFVTQTIINGNQIQNESNRKAYYKQVGLKLITDSLNLYTVGNSTMLNECYNDIKNIFKLIYKKEGDD